MPRTTEEQWPPGGPDWQQLSSRSGARIEKGDKTRAQIDFAGGAYVMDGTATKKDHDKRK